jgi:hypothetical protein
MKDWRIRVHTGAIIALGIAVAIIVLAAGGCYYLVLRANVLYGPNQHKVVPPVPGVLPSPQADKPKLKEL